MLNLNCLLCSITYEAYRVVASSSRGSQFKSRHQQIFIWIIIFPPLYRDDENNEKGAWIKKNVLHYLSLPEMHIYISLSLSF